MRKKILITFTVLAFLVGCTTTKESTSTVERHHVEQLMERMDSLMHIRTVEQHDSAWRETILRQFQSIREKSDTSRYVVADTAGRVIREKIVINNTREVTSESERHEREVLMQRLEVMDSTLSAIRQQQSYSDSILQQQTKNVEKHHELTWWQQMRLHLANIMLWAMLILGGIWFVRNILLKK